MPVIRHSRSSSTSSTSSLASTSSLGHKYLDLAVAGNNHPQQSRSLWLSALESTLASIYPPKILSAKLLPDIPVKYKRNKTIEDDNEPFVIHRSLSLRREFRDYTKKKFRPDHKDGLITPLPKPRYVPALPPPRRAVIEQSPTASVSSVDAVENLSLSPLTFTPMATRATDNRHFRRALDPNWSFELAKYPFTPDSVRSIPDSDEEDEDD